MARVDPTQLALLAVLTFLSVFVFRRFLFASPPPVTLTLLEGNNVSDGMTYHIQGVPVAWHEDQLQAFLAAHDCNTPVIRSLALEAHGRSQTGTVTFRSGKRLPEMPQGSLQPGTDMTALKLDTSFLRLSTLFSPPPEDHQIE